MRKRLSKFLIIILGVISFGLFSVACSDLSKEKPFDYYVTFNYNTGNLETEKIETQYLGVNKDSLVLKPGSIPAFKDNSVGMKDNKYKYFNSGWYLPQLDEEGNAKVNEDGFVLLDKEWDFKVDKVTSDVVLYAKIEILPTLTIKIEGGEDIVRDGHPGEVINKPSSVLEPKKKGFTFYGYYADAEYTTPFEWPYTLVPGNKDIYAKFIEGKWDIVNTAEELSDAIKDDANIYLDSDIDFAGKAWTAMTFDYSSEFNGNGHIVKGINCEFRGTKVVSGYFGMFGVLKKDSYIHDLVIENAYAEFTCNHKRPDYKAALFAWKAESGAKIENVQITGTLKEGNIKEGSAVELSQFIAIDQGATLTNCKFDEVIIQKKIN